MTCLFFFLLYLTRHTQCMYIEKDSFIYAPSCPEERGSYERKETIYHA